jgi:hypothetical protein
MNPITMFKIFELFMILIAIWTAYLIGREAGERHILKIQRTKQEIKELIREELKEQIYDSQKKKQR